MLHPAQLILSRDRLRGFRFGLQGMVLRLDHHWMQYHLQTNSSRPTPRKYWSQGRQRPAHQSDCTGCKPMIVAILWIFSETSFVGLDRHGSSHYLSEYAANNCFRSAADPREGNCTRSEDNLYKLMVRQASGLNAMLTFDSRTFGER